MYVDLNPLRAGLATTLGECDFTSAQRRIEALAEQSDEHLREEHRSVGGSHRDADGAAADAWLALVPVDACGSAMRPAAGERSARAGDCGFLPLTMEQYFDFLEWTGQQVVAGKGDVIPPPLAPKLACARQRNCVGRPSSTPMPPPLAPVLERLKIAEDDWLLLVRGEVP